MGRNAGAAGAPQEDSIAIEPDDVVVLGVATEKLKADPSLVHKPELGFFKDMLVGWGAVFPAAAKTNGDAQVILDAATEVEPSAATASASSSGAKPSGAARSKAGGSVALLDDDSDEELEMHKEMLLPLGELDEELADEEEKADKTNPEDNKPDPERLPKDRGPYPSLPPDGNPDPSDARKRVLVKVKQKAAEALASGNINKAIDRYTEAIREGGATALMLATRGALLLKQKRPCAAIRDCTAALTLNPDCGKAYHVRGVAHRRLGHWKKANRDLSKGQRLDFSADSVNVHMFVAKKVGAQDQRSSRIHMENPRKAVEVLFEEKERAEKRKRKGPTMDLRPGQAVRITGLLKAPHLNGRRGIVQRQSSDDGSRWEVELRMDRGKLEVKSIRGENVLVVRAADANTWKDEEAIHAEERRRQDKIDRRWQEEEDKRKKIEAQQKAARGEFFPDMEPSEKLEAEMSCLPISEEAMALLRRLRAQDGLDILQQVNVGGIGNLNGFIKIKARKILGEPDSEDESYQPTPAAWRADSAQQAASSTPRRESSNVKSTEAPPVMKPPPGGPSAATEDDSDSDDEDFDRLPEEKETMPDLGYVDDNAELDRLDRWKCEAIDALEIGDFETALKRYTKVITSGGKSALILTKRAELLLKQRRPCAAIRDCTEALALNSDLGKAYRVRGIANRKLGRWPEAHSDLVQGQRLDYDDGTAAVQKFVEHKATRKRRRDGPDPKRAKR